MTSMRVAMIGYGFMGAAHSQGWRVAPRFFDLPATPEMSLLVGRNGGCRGRRRPTSGAGQETATDWRAAIERDDIDIIDIVTPGDSHAEIAIAALEAGKHVLCEKPLANTVDEAEAMADAAERAARPRRLRDGRLHLPPRPRGHLRPRPGRIRQPSATVNQVRASYRQDWLVDPTVPLAWRLQKELAGSGALGDIGAHAIDLAQFITGHEAHERLGHHRHDHHASARCSRGRRASAAPPAPRPAPSPSTTSRCSPAVSTRACSAASRHPLRDRPQERAARRGLGLARARSRSTSRTSTRCRSTTAPRPPTGRGSRRSS